MKQTKRILPIFLAFIILLTTCSAVCTKSSMVLCKNTHIQQTSPSAQEYTFKPLLVKAIQNVEFHNFQVLG